MSDNRKAATAYAASSPRFVGKFPDNDADELWIADIKACTPGRECRVFRDVMFVESFGAAFLFGIEHEDGRPRGVRSDIADRQQIFVDFLREQNELMDLSVGDLAAVFQGSEYASEARATAAYMIHRSRLTNLAVGYRNREGGYVREKFEDEKSFLENARTTFSFDELGR